jgi:hypothetical protein
MKKEKFQEYLNDPDACKAGDISELKELLVEYPWFSTAGIILLHCSKVQSDPEFETLIKKHSLNITNRRILRTLMQSGAKYIPKVSDNPVKEEEVPITRTTREGDNDVIHLENESVISDLNDSLEDESLLDFSYTGKIADEPLPEEAVLSGSGPDDTLSLETEQDEENSESVDTHSRNFDQWIEKLGGHSDLENTPFSKHSIIESFITASPGVIRADKSTSIEGDISKASSEENEAFITDTLARIYVKQGLYNKAIFAYEKLSLKYPEKSIYFASQIEEIRNLYLKK